MEEDTDTGNITTRMVKFTKVIGRITKKNVDNIFLYIAYLLDEGQQKKLDQECIEL